MPIRRLAITACSALALSVPFRAHSAQDAHPTLSVGSATARRGETARGVLTVGAGVDSGTTMPVAVVHGAKPGPVVAVISGAHGTEYASIVAAMQLIDRIDPTTLSGSVIIAPLLNRPSFERMRVHVNPVDEKGMNASYPGNPSGTQTERALALVARQVIDPADVVLDLHNGDLDEDLRPYSYWLRTGDAPLDESTRKMALAFGLDHVIVRDIDTTNPAQIRSASGYALSKGKRSIVAEAGRAGLVTSEDVKSLVEGCLNVIGSLGSLRRTVVPVTRVTWLGEGQRVRADSAGVFFATARRDQSVKQGETLGHINDFYGRRVSSVVSPIAGKITFIRSVPSLWPGATIVAVGDVLASPPPWKKP